MMQEHALASVHTSNLPDILRQLNCSLLVTTYQAGRVILVRRETAAAGSESPDTLNTHFRPFDRPMGVCEKGGRLSIGGTNTVWEYRNVPGAAPKLDPQENTMRATCRAAFTSPATSTFTRWAGPATINSGW